eukprot:3579345-Alexandrium_andersonii.AAC.1
MIPERQRHSNPYSGSAQCIKVCTSGVSFSMNFPKLKAALVRVKYADHTSFRRSAFGLQLFGLGRPIKQGEYGRYGT